MRVVNHNGRAVGLDDLVDNRRQRGDQIKIKLAFQTFLNDLHVQHTKEAAAETKAQCNRGLGLKGQRCVVELELFQRIAQVGILGTILGVDTTVDHGLCLAIAGQRLRGRILHAGDCITDTGICYIFNRCREIANLACRQSLRRGQTQRVHIAAFNDLELSAGRHHAHLHARFHVTVQQAHINDDALVRVVLAVKDQCTQRCVRVAGRCRDVRYDALEHLVDIQANLCRNLGCILGRNADDVLDFLLDALRVGCWQVDLVDNRYDLQIILKGKVGIAQRLRLDALCGIYDQQCALARGERTRNLIVKVNMTRGVDEVHVIDLAVVCLVIHAHRACLDRNAALSLEIHIIEQLLLHLTLGDGLALFEQAVGQGGFTVVDVRDNGKIADIFLFLHTNTPSCKVIGRKDTRPDVLLY